MDPDFETPEAALAALEDAYRRGDLDRAVAAKDFVYEARAMLAALDNLEGNVDEDVVKQTAEVLELSFRTFTEENGFPRLQQRSLPNHLQKVNERRLGRAGRGMCLRGWQQV